MKQCLALLLCLLLPLACLAEGQTTPADDAALAAPSSPAFHEGDEFPQAPQTLTAEGQSEIAQSAGPYTIAFETAVSAETMDGARAAMAQRVGQLRELLQTQGAVDLCFTQANVRTLKEYFYTKLSQTVTTSGYAATCVVRAGISADGLDALLTALHEADMAQSYDILPRAQASPEALDQAVTTAAERAARSAQVLCAAMGRELDTLLSVDQTQEGTTVTVRVTYALKP